MSGRPIIYNVVQSFVGIPEAHRVLARLARLVPRSAGCGCTGRASPRRPRSRSPSRTGTCSTTAPHGPRRRSGRPGSASASSPIPHAARISATTASGIVTVPIPDIVVLECATPETKPFENLTVAEVAERTGKHPVDAMLDIAVADDLRTVFYAEPANLNRDALREIVDCRLGPSRRVRRRRAHEVLHRRPLSDGVPARASCARSRCARSSTRTGGSPRFRRIAPGSATAAPWSRARPADVVVYDLDRLASLPTEVAHDVPGGEWRRIQRARGYRYVLVNGEVTHRGRPRDRRACRTAPAPRRGSGRGALGDGAGRLEHRQPERRQRHHERLRRPCHGTGLARHAAEVALSAAAVRLGVAVQQLVPAARATARRRGSRGAGTGVKLQATTTTSPGRPAAAQVHQRALLGVAAVDPLEARRARSRARAAPARAGRARFRSRTQRWTPACSGCSSRCQSRLRVVVPLAPLRRARRP